MHRYVTHMETNELSVQDRVLAAFKDSTPIVCTGEKLDHTAQFELAVFDVGGSKRSLTEHVLRFSGVTRGDEPEQYHAVVADPQAVDAAIELFIGE